MKICKVCQNEFKTVQKSGLYCSKKCRVRASNFRHRASLNRYYRIRRAKIRSENPLQVFEKSCPVCLSSFQTIIEHQSFCGGSCRKKSRNLKRKPRTGRARSDYGRLHYLKNRERLIAKSLAYMKRRKQEDPAYRIRLSLRRRLRNLVSKLKSGKNGSCSLVGCSTHELRIHLENQFKPGMNWGNYATYWVVDHIKPLAKFNLLDLEERKSAANFKNLQPLTVEENHAKADNWTEPHEPILVADPIVG